MTAPEWHCPNSWHATAPARMGQRCPECPDEPPSDGGYWTSWRGKARIAEDEAEAYGLAAIRHYWQQAC